MIKVKLDDGEKEVSKTGLHEFVFLGPMFLMVLLCGSLIGMQISSEPLFKMILLLGTVLSALGLFVLGIDSAVQYITSYFLVTDKRAIIRTGFLRKVVIEFYKGKIEGVEIIQNPIEQVFDYGTLIIRGIGSGFMTFRNVKTPALLAQSLQDFKK